MVCLYLHRIIFNCVFTYLFYLCVLIDQISMGNVPLFINDTSNFWYKPHISREEGKDYIDKSIYFSLSWFIYQ